MLNLGARYPKPETLTKLISSAQNRSAQPGGGLGGSSPNRGAGDRRNSSCKRFGSVGIAISMLWLCASGGVVGVVQGNGRREGARAEVEARVGCGSAEDLLAFHSFGCRVLAERSYCCSCPAHFSYQALHPT